MELAVFIAAVAVVLATSLLKNVQWDVKTKHLVATVVAVVGAAVVQFATTGLAIPFWQLALSVHGASQAIYTFVLKGTKPGQALNTKLESSVVRPSGFDT